MEPQKVKPKGKKPHGFRLLDTKQFQVTRISNYGTRKCWILYIRAVIKCKFLMHINAPSATKLRLRAEGHK